MSIINNDEIDLIELFRTIWRGRKIIFYSVGICFFIGLVIGFTSPKIYTSSATLLPSADKKGAAGLGGLNSLAGLAGVNLGSMLGQDGAGIPVALYPKVVKSIPYLRELMHEKLEWEKYPQPMSIYEVACLKNKETSVGSIVMKYTLKLPWTIYHSLSDSPDNSEKKGEDDSLNVSDHLISLTTQELSAIAMLSKAIEVDPDKKSDLVLLKVEMKEPLLSAQLADKAVKLLQRYIIDYKTKQSREKLNFVEDRMMEAKQDYETSRNKLFYYQDVHRYMIDERVNFEYQNLMDAYEMSSSIYKGLAQQLEQAKITVKEETPVFSVLEPVVVPQLPSAPRKILILAVSIFLGGFLGVIFLLFRTHLKFVG